MQICPIAISNEKNKRNSLSGRVDCSVAALRAVKGEMYEPSQVRGGSTLAGRFCEAAP